VPIHFTLNERPLGWAAHTATPSEKLAVVAWCIAAPDDPATVQETLDQLQRYVLGHIPGLPKAGTAQNMVVVINPDLSGVAYVDEFTATAMTRVTRAVEAGEPLRAGDIHSIEELRLSVDVPDDAAVIVLQSSEWRRAVYFDFGPLAEPARARCAPLPKILATQLACLWNIGTPLSEGPGRTRVDAMAAGFQRLRRLLEKRSDAEREYQELLEDHPWMLGLGRYNGFQRHDAMNDENIPDFTGRRAADGNDDIVELKQPFLRCFKRNGAFSTSFMEAWDQAERYLTFARDQRSYLREEKGMRFETPRCVLLIGHEWTEEQTRLIRRKELNTPSITVMTYSQLLAQATEVLSVMRMALLENVQDDTPRDDDDATAQATRPAGPRRRGAKGGSRADAQSEKRKAAGQKKTPRGAANKRDGQGLRRQRQSRVR
jgi:hypothetical protein